MMLPMAPAAGRAETGRGGSRLLERYVALDIETTGLDPAYDDIIEIGAVRFLAGEPAERFSAFVRPRGAVPLRVQRLTGINPEQLRGAEPIESVLPRFLAWLGDDPLVGHNLGFDLAFLDPLARAHGHGGLRAHCDTLELARVCLPGGRHGLAQLAAALGVELTQAHRASHDAAAAGAIFRVLAERVAALPPALLQLCARLLAPVPGGLRDVFVNAATEALTRPLGGRAGRYLPPFPAELSFAAQAAGEQTGEPRPIDARAIAAEFGPDGCFARRLPGYEHRPPQAEMAMRVARALNRGEHLLMEAGTGTGKSMAYLLPALRFAASNNERVVISTHTINLQEQLWYKDIPMLREVLGEDIRCALVKGRANYICLRKWLEVVEDEESFLTPEERVFHARLAVWLQQTASGDRAELNLFGAAEQAWARVAADSLTCRGAKCRFFKAGCFVMRSRRAAESAQLLIVNHSLLFSDLSTENRVLPPYRHLIIDEAHNVEDAATQHLGVKFEHVACRSWLLGLFGGFRGGVPGYLGALRGRLQRLAEGGAQDILSAVEDGIGLVKDGLTACDEMFELVRRFAEDGGRDDDEDRLVLRVTAARRESASWRAVQAAGDNLASRLKRLAGRLNALADLAGEYNEVHAGVLKGVPEDCASLAAAAFDHAAGLEFVLAADRADQVYWVETDRAPERQRGALCAAPVRVGDILRERLFDRQRSVILTSATLTVRGQFEFAADRLGLAAYGRERLATGAVASPFNYGEQALCCVPSDMPVPKPANEREFRLAAVAFLAKLLPLTNGRTLVLFTSHRMLRDVYYQIKPELESADICALAQGIDGSRTRLVEDLQTSERTVVFGASSFWEGVDIPGEQLSCVVIVKLPFPAPGQPVIEARSEEVKQRGRSDFYDYSLPQAVLRFKQGFGRLIRRQDDAGVVVVLDSRLADPNCRYGKHFLESLPGPRLTVAPQSQLLAEIGAWLAGRRTATVSWADGAADNDQ